MSSETYYIVNYDAEARRLVESGQDSLARRVAEKYLLNETQIKIVQASIDAFSKARQAISQQLSTKYIHNSEARSKYRGRESFTANPSNVESIVPAMSLLDEAAAQDDAKLDSMRDFSHVFSLEKAESKEAIVSNAKYRARSLYPLTAKERGSVDRFLSRCAECQANASFGADELRDLLLPELAKLCSELNEEHTDLRREAYIDYLATCQLTNEEPKELGFDQMVSRTHELQAKQIDSELRKHSFNAVLDSLPMVGLVEAKKMTLNGDEGYLFVDEDDLTCGLFVAPDTETEKAFLFTTVSSERIVEVGGEKKAAVRNSARSLCKKKDSLVNEILPALGVELATSYEFPVSDNAIRWSKAFSEYAKERQQSRARRSGLSSGSKTMEG